MRKTRPNSARVLFLLGLIVLVESALVYLCTWIAAPQQTLFIPVTIAEYQATPLAVCVRAAGSTTAWREQSPFAETMRVDTTRQAILDKLDLLARRGSGQPVVVYLAALAIQADDGDVYLLPSDATPDDALTWLRLRDVLVKLKACPTRQKLLMLDLTPTASARLGSVYQDVAQAVPQELKAVPDPDRWVFCSHSAGQTSQIVEASGLSIFSYYLQQALRGHADGCEGMSDGHITVKEAAAFVRNRVERWSWRNRGERQTPTLFGAGHDFALIAVDPAATTVAPPTTAAAPPAREYPAWLLEAWKASDAAYEAGQYRLAPRLFQQQQAMLLATEQAWRAGVSEPRLRKQWLPECERLRQALQRTAKEFAADGSNREALTDPAKKTFAEWWRLLQQQSAAAKPADLERIKNRMMDDLRGKLPAADLDTAVFAHALSESRVDPGTLRLYDRLLHPTAQTVPRTGRTLALRQLADLAMRIEVSAWPADLIESLLRATELGERALEGQGGRLPGFHALLEEPTQHRHAGEVRLWAHGYTNLDEAKQRLTTAIDQFDRLLRLNEHWQRDKLLLEEALAELPGYLGLLETSTQGRLNWERATAAARTLADTLQPRADDGKKATLNWNEQVGRLTAQVQTVQTHARALREHLRALREPFAKEELSRLERQCRSADADPAVFRSVEAILSMTGPNLRAGERVSLWQAGNALSRRLHEETLALDRQDNDAKKPTALMEIKAPAGEDEAGRAAWRVRTRLALFELAGVTESRLRPLRQQFERASSKPEDVTGWCEVGVILQRLIAEQLPRQYGQEIVWQRRARLAWGMSPLDRYAGIDDADTPLMMQGLREEKQSQDRWLREHYRYLARDYRGLNLESPGIQAARKYYTEAHGGKGDDEARVRFKIVEPVEPMTQKSPYAHLWLEVTRQLPRGKLGPLELQFQRGDEHWLEIAPASATLAEVRFSNSPRELVSKVPLKVTRKPLAERSGLPAPAGFLAEARLEGRSWHHLVTTPIPNDARELQILVSTDTNGPQTTVNEIHVRPGNTKQAHHVYVKNLTNRARKVHVEISAASGSGDGRGVLHKTRQPLALEPDGVHKVTFDELPAGKSAELRGPLEVRVLDQEREKVLEARTVRVEIMSPHDYVKVAEVSYAPGLAGNNKWHAQVQTAQRVAGPAIAAELVLPMRHIPGLVGVGGGTLHIELPTHARTARMLFAERIRIDHDGEREGPVYLTIDGVPRAFVYRTTFSRTGAPMKPSKDDRPAVRLVAPGSIMAGVNYLVDVEVDNAPRGAKLEVALGRMTDNDTFRAEVVREYVHAKEQRIGLETTKDALVFEASIKDWTATFETKSIVGARELRARLLDSTGKEIALASQPVVIDNTPPIARFLSLPPAKRGATIEVQAEGMDADSGIGQVVFFLGVPDKGEIPATAVKLKATPGNPAGTLWTTLLLVPANHKGPLPISVYVVNNAGMASVDTVTLEVQEEAPKIPKIEPRKTGLGEIRGKVVEGPRPQPNLVVTLTDEGGKEIARTRTGPDGAFAFDRLAPGRYRLLCVKPESQRRATQAVTVDPDRLSDTELSLSL